MNIYIKALSCCFVLLAACSDDKKPSTVNVYNKENYTNVLKQTVNKKSEKIPDFLEQNWNHETRMEWWYTSQGSRLLPYDWFLALEQPDNEKLVSAKENLEQYRFIAWPADSKWNPEGLPIGFVADKDSTNGTRYLGFTCAACHTGKIVYKENEFIIEGAPAHHDFDRFITEIANSLQKTSEDSDKFSRFSGRVLGVNSNPDQLAALKELLTREKDKLGQRVKMNHPPETNGYGRLDAFGNIFNEVVASAINDPSNIKLSDAPVSYPMLWDTPQHNVVQWNGLAVNAGIGPYVRNAGEVVGVFGDLNIKKAVGESPEISFQNHINITNLARLEDILTTLWSPLWPEALPKIDQVKALQGKQLYEAQCTSCHHDIKRDDPLRKIEATMVPLDEIGTDAKTATNIASRTSITGILEGQPMLPINMPNLPKLGKIAPSAQLVVYSVVGSLRDGLNPAIFSAGLQGFVVAAQKNALRDNCDPKQLGEKCIRPPSYKARPLNGIWTSAPYFHNGSIPNLWELLQKPEQRVSSFNVGSWEFDPVKVGFVTREEPATSNVNTALPGNSNSGHDYGSSFTDTDKWCLIEYLKTL